MAYIKILLLAVLVTTVASVQTKRKPKVLIYDITEKKGEKPQVKLLSVQSLRVSPDNDNQPDRDDQEENGQQDWVNQARTSKQKLLSKLDWNKALQNIINNANEQQQYSSHEQQNTDGNYRDSSHEQQYLSQLDKDSYEQQNVHEKYKNPPSNQQSNDWYDELYEHDRDSTYEQRNAHKKRQNNQPWNKWIEQPQYKNQLEHPNRAHAAHNRYHQSIQNGWDSKIKSINNNNNRGHNRNSQNKKFRTSLDDQQQWQKSSNKNSGKNRNNNQWSSQNESNNLNRKRKQNQKNKSLFNPNVHFSEDYADYADLDDFEAHRLTGLSSSNSLLPQFLEPADLKRDKREAERLSIIQNLKSLVRKLQKLDDGNIAQLYGNAQLRK